LLLEFHDTLLEFCLLLGGGMQFMPQDFKQIDKPIGINLSGA
jgi:hypothetical protein